MMTEALRAMLVDGGIPAENWTHEQILQYTDTMFEHNSQKDKDGFPSFVQHVCKEITEYMNTVHQSLQM